MTATEQSTSGNSVNGSAAEPEAIAELWDRLVASAQSQGKASTQGSRSLQVLRLKRSPEVKRLPTLERRLDLIPGKLRAGLRSLVSGRIPWPLFCFGPPGTGKTRAALALIDYCQDAGYWEVPRLCEALIEAGQSRYRPEGELVFQADIWRWLAKQSIVVLDEIGARDRVSDFHYESVKRVLDERERKPCVYLSNLGPEALEVVYDARIVSRLCAGTVIELDGPDQRVTH